MPRLTDISFEGDRIWLSWVPEVGEEFEDELEFVKATLSGCDRKWNPERKQWHVRNDDESVAVVEGAFEDAKTLIQHVRNQLDLFTRG